MKRLLFVLLISDLAWGALEFVTLKRAPATATPRWSLLLTHAPEGLHRQWEATDTPVPFLAGRWRLGPEQELPFALPRLTSEAGQRVRTLPASGLEGAPHAPSDGELLVVRYDTFTGLPADFPAVRPRTEAGGALGVLLDASATMSQPFARGQKEPAYRMALMNLLARRKVEPGIWNLYTFSEGLRSQGSWPESSAADLLAALPQPVGRTRLLEALRELLSGKKELEPRLVVVSDGALTESDRRDVEDALKQVRARGSSIALLSPELKPLPRFAFAYAAGLAADAWPPSPQTETLAADEVLEPRSGRSIPWKELPETRGPGLLPLLFGRSGRPAVYLGSWRGAQVLHVVGQPQATGEELAAAVRVSGVRPVARLDAAGLTVDLLGREFRPLSLQRDGVWHTLAPEAPGIFRWPLKAPWPTVIQGFHPACGAFALRDLESLAPLLAPRPAPLAKAARVGGAVIEVFTAIAAPLLLALHAAAYLYILAQEGLLWPRV